MFLWCRALMMSRSHDVTPLWCHVLMLLFIAADILWWCDFVYLDGHFGFQCFIGMCSAFQIYDFRKSSLFDLRSLVDDPSFHQSVTKLSSESTPYFNQFHQGRPGIQTSATSHEVPITPKPDISHDGMVATELPVGRVSKVLFFSKGVTNYCCSRARFENCSCSHSLLTYTVIALVLWAS